MNVIDCSKDDKQCKHCDCQKRPPCKCAQEECVKCVEPPCPYTDCVEAKICFKPKPDCDCRAYGYFFNTDCREVECGKKVKLCEHGIRRCVEHKKCHGTVTVEKDGAYYIAFYVTARDCAQLSLYKNGCVIKGSTYKSHCAQNSGAVLVRLCKGDKITLVNTGDTPIKLEEKEGAVNASLTVIKID